MAAPFLPEGNFNFPALHKADEDGLLFVTMDMTWERLMAAYTHGAFPWFQEDIFTYWFAPNPRCVLKPEKLRITKSMQQLIKKKTFSITYNTCFTTVIEQCGLAPRKPTMIDGILHSNDSTWINQEYINQYEALHNKGHGLSAEVWQDGRLVGGLYGVLMGKVFYGESMFSLVSNASKYALIEMIGYLRHEYLIELIDCQQATPHLLSLGAECISSKEFAAMLKELVHKW